MALRPQHQFLRGFLLLSLSFFFCLAIKFHWFLCGGEYGAGSIKTSKGCLDKLNARKKRTASLCRYQERVTSLGAGGWGQTHSSFPGAYLKAAYFFSNLHAGGFCRSLWALRPWCDPGGTDSQAPHLMTAALPSPTPPPSIAVLGWYPLTVSLEVQGSVHTRSWKGNGRSFPCLLSVHNFAFRESYSNPMETQRLHPPQMCGCYRDTRHTRHFRTQIHKFLICEKYKMKPCTSYVQTLFTRQESYHWLLQMTELSRSFQSTSI